MRFLPLLLAALPLVAALPAPAEPANASAVVGNERHLGWPCTKSSQCGTKDLYCRRGKCDVRKKLGSKCYKSIGCISNKCSEKRCVAGAVLTLGERCETSKSCASTYCGKSKCAVPQPVGADCYKPAGCLSGICTDHKCAAPATTPNPDPTTPPTTPKDPSAPQDPSPPQDPSTPTNPTPNPPTDEVGNVSDNGHFEDDEAGLAPWQTIGETKRSDVDYTAWDGTHYAILEVNEAGGPGLYQQPYTEPPPTRRDGLEARDTQIPSAYDVSLRYRVNKIANAGAKGCRLAVLYDGKAPDASGVVRYTSASSEWKELRANVKSDEAIQYLFIVMDCPDGGTTTVHIDDINFVPLAPEEPAFTPTDVAMNGGFESGDDFWTFEGNAELSTAYPAADGIYTARLYDDGGFVRQLIELPAGTKVQGFHSYDVKFKYRLVSYAQGDANVGVPACRLDVSRDDERPTKQLELGAGDVGLSFVDVTVTVTSDQDFVKAIMIDSYCGDHENAKAEILIDAVQILSRNYTPPTTTPTPTPTPEPTKTEPTNVARNPGFESGKDQWTFAGQSSIGTENSNFDEQYAVLTDQSSISQVITMPAESKYDGYYSYDLKFKYRVPTYSGTSGSYCMLYAATDRKSWYMSSVVTITKADTAWTDYAATVDSDGAFIEKVSVGLICSGGSTMNLNIDQVQFVPGKYLPPLNDVCVNGSFEDDTIAPWAATLATRADGSGNSGTHYALLSSSGSNLAKLTQTIVLPARYPEDGSDGYHSYKVSLAYKISAFTQGEADPGTESCYFGLSWNDNGVSFDTIVPIKADQSVWTSYTRTLSDEGNISKISILFQCTVSASSAFLQVDSVQFKPVKN